MRVMYFCAPVRACRIGASMCEECEREDVINDATRLCDICDKEIAVGARMTKLTNVDRFALPEEYGVVEYLHHECADAYTMDYDEYFENIHD